MRRLLPLVAALAVLGGCGSSVESQSGATLLLDFTPNAVHTGIYTSVERDFDGGEGVKLGIREPSQSTDSVKLLASGQVDFAVLDIHDLGVAREHGRDLVGVYALVQEPLASLIARPGIRSPRQLPGRRVGVSGLPSDTAVLRSIVSHAGGDPARVRQTTIGFDAVGALLGRKVAAATAFWNVEGVALKRRRPGFHIFRVDDFGAPSYPELVLCVRRSTLRDQPALVHGVMAALRRGYGEVLKDPATAVSQMLDHTHGLSRAELSAQLDAVQTAFQAPDGTLGELDPGRLRAWARWDARFGILHRPIDVSRAFVLSKPD